MFIVCDWVFPGFPGFLKAKHYPMGGALSILALKGSKGLAGASHPTVEWRGPHVDEEVEVMRCDVDAMKSCLGEKGKGEVWLH